MSFVPKPFTHKRYSVFFVIVPNKDDTYSLDRLEDGSIRRWMDYHPASQWAALYDGIVITREVTLPINATVTDLPDIVVGCKEPR